jgi:TubC N-terminal docking domain/Thioesterase domain
LNVPAFLGELLSRDIRLSADGGQLKCSAPPGALTPQLREQLRSRKAEILEFLRKSEAIARLPAAIVPLQPQGTRIPIFGVGGHNGDVYSFRDLARHLGEDQPFFGLWPPGLDGKSEPLARIEDLGAYLAAQVRAFRPSGACIVAAYCGGGAPAYELARQLAQSGTEVPLLALFGCQHPASYRFRLPYWGRRVAYHTRVAAGLSSFEELRAYVGGRIRGRLEQLRRERTPPGDDPESLIKHRFEKITLAAVQRYTPGPFSGRLCLFIPNRGWLREEGAALRWRRAAPRTEEYYGPDSVDPDRMLVDPDAAVFARLFEKCLWDSAPQARQPA